MAETTTRDPRVDPMPGDVLEWPGWRRKVIGTTISGVIYVSRTSDGDDIRDVTNKYAWRLWSRHATVVSVPEPKEPQERKDGAE